MNPASTANVLNGQVLLWGIWDQMGVVAAALAGMLDSQLANSPNHITPGLAVRSRMLRGDHPQQLEQLATQRTLGMAVWVLASSSDGSTSQPVTLVQVTAVCQASVVLRNKHPHAICVCFLDPISSDYFGMLVAAGIELIVSDLASLQRSLPRLVSHAPHSTHGYHALTTGLTSRLPWPS